MKILSFSLITTFLLGIMACTAQDSPKNNTPAATTPTPTAAPVTSTYADLNVAEFQAKMEGDNVVLLDVRTPGETAQGKIEGAMEIDFRAADFNQKIMALDKDKTYLIYCRSGNRSGHACKMMAKEGFKDLYNLEGGFLSWSKQ